MSPRPAVSARRALLLASVCLLLIVTALSAAPPARSVDDTSIPEGRLLRFPTLSNDSIAFVYGGDLWTVPRAGGLARQLTTDAGLEWLPRYSPDGRWIAFSGQYDGNRDIYVIPAAGGEPKRLTWWTDTGQPSERQGPNNMVIGWTPDSQRVLFRSRHQAWEDRAGRLYTVGLDASLPEQVGSPRGASPPSRPTGRRFSITGSSATSGPGSVTAVE